MPQQVTKDITEMSKQWSKAQLYQAYNIEHHARKQLEGSLKQMGRELAKLRFEAQATHDQWLKMHILHNVSLRSVDPEADIAEFFKQPYHRVEYTPSNGYIAFLQFPDKIEIFAAWGNPRHYRAEMGEMHKLIKSIAGRGLPVFYTGLDNVLKNHSTEVEPGIWQVMV